MIQIRPFVLFALSLLAPALSFGDSRDSLIATIDDRYAQDREIALDIWGFAEPAGRFIRLKKQIRS